MSVRAVFSRNLATKLRMANCFFVSIDELRPVSVSTSIGILLIVVSRRNCVRASSFLGQSIIICWEFSMASHLNRHDGSAPVSILWLNALR